jgi:hypothetical protein
MVRWHYVERQGNLSSAPKIKVKRNFPGEGTLPA